MGTRIRRKKGETVMFVVRKEVLKAAFADEATRGRIDRAVSLREVEMIVAEFAEKNGFKVAFLEDSVRKQRREVIVE